MMSIDQKHFESLYPAHAREKELHKIVTYIREGNSCQLIGIPGSGRSNVTGFLAYNREIRLKHFPTKNGFVHFVPVNFSEIRTRPFPDVVKFIFLSLVTSLSEREMLEEYEKVNSIFKESLSYGDELILTQGLKNAVDYLSIEKKLTLVMLFDRFEAYVQQLTPELFILLRSLRDRAKYRFSVVFSLLRPLEESVEPQIYADFSDFIAGHEIYLPLYDEPSITFRLGYLQKLTKLSFPEMLEKELVKLTGGHVRLMKVASEALISLDEMPTEVSSFLLLQPTVKAALQSILNGLTPAELLFLYDHQGEASDYLLHTGLIDKKELVIPLLDLYIPTISKKIDSPMHYDEVANTINQGEKVLSDTLTKAEFRLLRFLLQNTDRIIEREEIIGIVWGDGASTAGVTEQAIDQLIFRLRRKIEANPNDPHHLFTIKGRGVKFAQ